MTSDPDLHRRVDRLENDTESIYELIGDFRTEFGEFRTEVGEFQAEFRAELGDFRAEVGEFRAEVGEFRAEVGEFRAETGSRFDRIEKTLVEVVRRLPELS